MSDGLNDPKSRSAQCTFLVRIVTVRAHEVVGRVEHIWSGDDVDFDSGDALLEFLRRVAGRLGILRGGADKDGE